MVPELKTDHLQLTTKKNAKKRTDKRSYAENGGKAMGDSRGGNRK
jgi:hypothetical protein